jgi:PDDEXK-like uncharacterized protein DUF3799
VSSADTRLAAFAGVLTEPGIYDIPEAAYHADPVAGGSLSSTIARKILACPALAKHALEHPEFKDAWDLGSVVHHKVLGKGPELVEVDAPNWNGKAAQEARTKARARGAVALLAADMRKAEAMTKAVLDHPLAGPLFQPGTGTPERTVIWQDPDTGAWCRAMLDWFPNPALTRPIGVDLKSTHDPAPAAIARHIANFGYHQQEDFYRRGAATVPGLEDAGFVFVFAGTAPPHIVTVVELDDDALEEGWRRNQKALRLWVECRSTGVWPAYSDDIVSISLPRWTPRIEDTP